MNKKTMISITAVVMAFLAIYIIGANPFNAQMTGAAISAKNDGEFTIPASGVTEKVKFYEYDYNGKTIKFFAVRANDGSIKTGFDACDVCYGSKKGYRQEGDYLVCNNCGKRFAISGLGTENKNPGGCWPGHLPGVVIGENLAVEKSDLEAGVWRF